MITALREKTAIATIDGIPVQLGDVVTWGHGTDMASKFTQATRVQGWSPDGDRLYLGWAGDVATADCKWYQQVNTADLAFALQYCAVSENRWGEKIRLDSHVDLSSKQLELVLTGIGGKLMVDPCTGLKTGNGLIPGLDACLCRCPQCTTRAARGVWWVDKPMRDRLTMRRGKEMDDAA